jgi:biopolymer transport protein ExbD
MSKHKKMVVKSAINMNSDINVTPLVDVVLVLLIIFMVVTPLLEKDIQIRVPDTEQTELNQVVDANQLIVTLSKDNEISINFEKIPDADYVMRLKRMIYAKAPGDRLVFFMPDEKANYGKLVAALDGARQAGAEILGMMTETAETAGQPTDPNAPGGAAPGTPSGGTTP